jgi:hypothetical protein
MRLDKCNAEYFSLHLRNFVFGFELRYLDKS